MTDLVNRALKMDEFALCWNNFQDNIATGFQNLYDRGDLVDVTLACDGKLLQAHKIVLAICSPYFQEMFITNPCKHPIIILKDVSFTVMSELLQFMYEGQVNVKHSDLSIFMKIAETLQIKGLTTTQKSPSPSHNNNQSSLTSKNSAPQSDIQSSSSSSNNVIETRINTNAFSSSGGGGGGNGISGIGNHSGKLEHLSSSSSTSSTTLPQKRSTDYTNESFSGYPKKQLKRTSDINESDINHETIDNMTTDEVFLPPIPHISMVESRFDLNSVKRETGDSLNSPINMRNSGSSSFNYDYGSAVYGGSKIEYPNDLHDFSKGINHMDIPAVAPGGKWFQGKLEFTLSQRGKPLLVHDGHTFGIQYIRKDKKYWQCNLSRKFNCKARVTTTDTGEIIVTNNEHCHTEIRQHLRKDYKNKINISSLSNASLNSSTITTSSTTSNNNNNNSSTWQPKPEIN